MYFDVILTFYFVIIHIRPLLKRASDPPLYIRHMYCTNIADNVNINLNVLEALVPIARSKDTIPTIFYKLLSESTIATFILAARV